MVEIGLEVKIPAGSGIVDAFAFVDAIFAQKILGQFGDFDLFRLRSDERSSGDFGKAHLQYPFCFALVGRL
jgi:hypothetical protein